MLSLSKWDILTMLSNPTSYPRRVFVLSVLVIKMELSNQSKFKEKVE